MESAIELAMTLVGPIASWSHRPVLVDIRSREQQERNIYSKQIQFEELAQTYPPLLEHVKSGRPIDFRDAKAQRCLTQALLHRDFGLRLTLPQDRLCPPVPNRLNYVLWIQDIMRYHDFVLQDDVRTIHGIDIGTGASAIYPLLACKMEPSWKFIATEIDNESLKCAEHNIQINKLEDRIRLMRASPDGPILFPLEGLSGQPFDFIMCNPPFYASRTEITRLAESKEAPPSSVCTGADTEMIYLPGGEAAFIGQMVDESERHRGKCRWFTSMMGKMSTISEIVTLLRKRSIRTYAMTEFVQGQTRRWGIAWSFTKEHIPDSFGRLPVNSFNALHFLQPPKNTLIGQFQLSSSSINTKNLQATLLRICSLACVVARECPPALEKVSSEACGLTTLHLNPVIVQADTNTWSRRARRNPVRSQSKEHGLTTPQSSIALMCRMQWLIDTTQVPGRVILESNWVLGDDRMMFEGLVSHIVKKMAQEL